MRYCKQEQGSEVLGSNAGTVLVASVFLLSLMSLIVVCFLRDGGIGNTACGQLTKKSQATMAALSGVDISYMRLAVDQDYTGELCLPFDGATGTVDVNVTPLGDSRFEVLSRGTTVDAECLIRTQACATPIGFYPLTVGNNVFLKGDSKILGECYVKNYLWGKELSEITGNVYLMGERDIVYDMEGKPISIDGYPSPVIGGETICNSPVMDFPGVILGTLREIAEASGQVYSGTKHFSKVNLTGVVYIEGSKSRPYFKDVTIDGVLVCDNVPEVRIEGGFFKIHCDNDICRYVALLAPQSTLWVDPNANIDVFGLSYFSSADIQGSGTFTGPLVVTHDLVTLPDSYLYCQFPSYMRNQIDPENIWSELLLVELEYEEL
jgi:hypothetical protein